MAARHIPKQYVLPYAAEPFIIPHSSFLIPHFSFDRSPFITTELNRYLSFTGNDAHKSCRASIRTRGSRISFSLFPVPFSLENPYAFFTFGPLGVSSMT